MSKAKFGTLICFVLVALTLSGANAQKKSSLPQWQSSKAFAGRLAPVVKFSGYNIRPPAGYVLKQMKDEFPKGMEAFGWRGPKRKDGSRSILLLAFALPPLSEPGRGTLEQKADGFLAGMNTGRMQWHRGKTESGTIRGWKFARIYWGGTEKRSKRKVAGFVYVAMNGDLAVQLCGIVTLPEEKDNLRLLEAAALTFKKS